MPRRVPPPPATGRKPQTGARPGPDGRPAPVLGARLSYLLWVQRQGGLEALQALARQEQALQRRHVAEQRQGRQDGPRPPPVPSPLTAPLRLRPDEDSRLRLPRVGNFDPSRPAVAVAIEFLGSARDLPELGAIAATQVGDTIIGWVNLHELPRLARHPATVRLEALRGVATPTGDTQDSAGAGPGGPGGVAAGGAATGKGVRLAVIDNGFDFLHPAFVQGQQPQVRALLLHDLALQPPAGAPAGSLGQRFAQADLQAALAWHNDLTRSEEEAPAPVAAHLARLDSTNTDIRALLWRHGTAVMGIAAGNGQGGGPVPPAVGAAPDAELQLYAIGLHDERRFADTSEVHVAFDAAFKDAAGAPCVALMANSDNLGPHDGSLDGEVFLDELLLLPGRAIVLTAGNQNHTDPLTEGGARPLHAVVEPDAAAWPLRLRFDSGAVWPESAEIWFRRQADAAAATADITAEIRGAVSGPVTVAESPAPQSPEEVPVWTAVLDPAQNPDGTLVEALLQYDPETEAHALRLVFRPVNGPDIAPSLWKIEITGADGPVHAWLDRNSGGLGRWEGAAAQAGASRTTLGSPAGATRPFAVGSVARVEDQATPSTFSGRGPVRTPPQRPQRKPDLVAKGEVVRAPLGWPAQRVLRQGPPRGQDYADFRQGTSYAAPQVAGVAARLFEQFGPSDPLLGPAASWADLRQVLLQSATRLNGMPPPDPEGWDPACGYGLIDPQSQPAPQPAPAGPDLWMARAPGDATGAEPFVAWRFWDSPDLMLLDAEGRPLDPVAVAVGEVEAAQIRVRVANRGTERAEGIGVAVWWAPLGALHPSPRPGAEPGGEWRTEGIGEVGGQGADANTAPTPCIAPGESAEVTLSWEPPRNEAGRIRPHQILVAVHEEGDPYDPDQPICATNNTAVLTVAAVRGGEPAVPFTILGTDETDGVVLWREGGEGGLRVENLPVTALPWREAAIFAQAGRRSRPLHGEAAAPDDPALGHDAVLEGDEVEAVTDVQGAGRLVLRDGLATIEGGPKLVLPRLRIAHGASLEIHALAAGTKLPCSIHLLHLSGGRRVGGGTFRMSPS